MDRCPYQFPLFALKGWIVKLSPHFTSVASQPKIRGDQAKVYVLNYSTQNIILVYCIKPKHYFIVWGMVVRGKGRKKLRIDDW